MLAPRYPVQIYFAILFCWTLLCPTPVFSQEKVALEDTLSQLQFIAGCASYRQHVIHDWEDVMTEFVNLSKGLSQTSTPYTSQTLKNMFLDGTLVDGHDNTVCSMDNTVQRMHLDDDNSSVCFEKWFVENRTSIMEIQFLISNGMLEATPPYVLSNLKDLWREFHFYGLRANMTIADIGAGNGMISFIMLESGLPIHLVMTEIDKGLLSILRTKMANYSHGNESSSMSVAKGTEKELGLDDLKVDRMILREVFHHLNNPKSILKDISLHLEPDGYLILKEGTKDLKNFGGGRCIEATTFKRITKEFDAAGYRLVAKEIIGASYMLKFKLAN